MSLTLLGLAAAAVPALLQAGADALRDPNISRAVWCAAKDRGSIQDGVKQTEKFLHDQAHYHEKRGWEKDN